MVANDRTQKDAIQIMLGQLDLYAGTEFVWLYTAPDHTSQYALAGDSRRPSDVGRWSILVQLFPGWISAGSYIYKADRDSVQGCQLQRSPAYLHIQLAQVKMLNEPI